MIKGITAGFGDLIGSDMLSRLQDKRWQAIRQDIQKADAAKIQQMVDEIRNEALLPILMGEAARAVDIPMGLDFELRDAPDMSKSGLEPNFTQSPQAYAITLNKVVPILKDKNIRAWAGMVNTDDPNAMNWLKTVVNYLDLYFGISVHRYPPSNATKFSDSLVGGREKEFQNLKSIIKDRPFSILEWGYNQGSYKSFWQKIFGGHGHLTDAQIVKCVKDEFAYWESKGAVICSLYQLNDGTSKCAQHPQYPSDYLDGFGLRRADGTWKPVSDIWR
jgi:hypothetical protein